ncbi:hypothetical protein WA026_021539 [Henosepilachna vigintioctopunctata]|uniref:Uncharacterized protein n=1 Tax=Henosepilachna vigintioctopunctata TaxID=420089 RepID=A0AAW1VH22_9CUCU
MNSQNSLQQKSISITVNHRFQNERFITSLIQLYEFIPTTKIFAENEFFNISPVSDRKKNIRMMRVFKWRMVILERNIMDEHASSSTGLCYVGRKKRRSAIAAFTLEPLVLRSLNINRILQMLIEERHTAVFPDTCEYHLYNNRLIVFDVKYTCKNTSRVTKQIKT